MSTGPTRFDPSAYAAQMAGRASASVRPKSDYGRAVEAKQRRDSYAALSHHHTTIPTASSSPSSTPRLGGARQRASPPRWRSPRDASPASRATPTSTPSARRAVQASPMQARPPAHVLRAAPLVDYNGAPSSKRDANTLGNEVVEEQTEKDVELSSAALEASASTLLKQLQQVVVQTSRQVVAERRHATRLHDQIHALEAVVAEQDAMLDQLNRDNEAAQQEKAQLMRSYQQELRRSVEGQRGGKETGGSWHAFSSASSAATLLAPRHNDSIEKVTRISATAVDQYVVAEFSRVAKSFALSGIHNCNDDAVARRSSNGYGGISHGNPFDEVTPNVAAVLRSLATQVLQLRQTPLATTEMEGNMYAELRTASGSNQVKSDSAESRSIHSGSTSPVLVEKTPAAPPSAAAFLSASQNRNLAKPAQPTVSPASQVDHPSAFHSTTAVGARRVSRTSITAEHQKPSQERAVSESSASVDSSVYEDAATILSDIRARYGL